MSESQANARLLGKGENEHIAFIDSPRELGSIARTVCAMLNSAGGVVLAGVNESGRVVHGASDEDVDAVRSFLHQHITPQTLFTVALDDIEDGPIISVDVPKGADRPYVFDGAVYVRSGPRTDPADADTLRGMVEQRALESERWERRAASGLGVENLDRELMKETVRRAQDSRGYRFEKPNDPNAVLGDLSLLHFGQLTNAADVLFGRRVAQRHPQTRVRAVCYESDRGHDFVDEQLFEGPAFTLLDAAMSFLKRHVRIAARFQPGQLARETRPEYPFWSLREGLVNALVHRDYASFSGGVSVSVYPGRVEIWNSGRLPEGLTPGKLRGVRHESILVNPDISHVFYLHELMERVGRGTFMIVQQCREMGMKQPDWREASSGVRLTFHAALGHPGRWFETNPRQESLLRDLGLGEAVRLREYLERYGSGISDRQARRDVRELVDAGYLRQIGAGPTRAYERTDMGQ